MEKVIRQNVQIQDSQKFLGSSSGYTSINGIDIDSDLNIVFAGNSTDSNIKTYTSLQQFVAYLPSGSYSYEWAKVLNVYDQELVKLVFRPDGQSILMVYRVPLIFIIISSTDGSLLASASNSGDFNRYNAVIDNSNYIYTVLQQNNQWNECLICLNIVDEYSKTAFAGIRTDIASQVHQIEFGGASGELFTGAQWSTSDSYHLYQMIITRVVFSGVTSSTVSWKFYNSQAQINQYQFERLYYYSSGTAEYLFAGGGSFYLVYGISLLRVQLNGDSGPTNDQTFTYSLQPNFIQILDLKAQSDAIVSVLITDYNEGTAFLLTVDFSDATQASYTKTVVTTSDYSGSMIKAGIFYSDTVFYFTGYVQSIDSCTSSTYSSGIGFIQVQDSEQSCATLGTTTSTYTKSYLSTSFSSSTSITNTHLTWAFTRNTITLTDILTTKSLYEVATECCYSLTTPTFSDQKYVIDYPEEEYQFPEFTLSMDCSDITIKYTSKVTYSGNTDVELPSYIDFDTDTLIFTVYTSDQSTLDDYDITVTATLPTQQQYELEFTISFYSTVTLSIVSKTIDDLTYILSDEELTYTFDAFRASNPDYYVIYFLTNEDDSEYDSTMITFNDGGQDTTIKVYSTDNNKVGTYNLKIYARFTENTDTKAYSTFSLTLLTECYLTKIEPSQISDKIYEYTSTSTAPLTFYFDSWKETKGHCGTFTYYATSNEEALPDFIMFTQSQRKFIVKPTDTIITGEYNIQVQGTLSFENWSDIVEFTIAIECNVKTLSPSSTQTIADQIYSIGTLTLVFVIQDFEQYPKCSKTIEYDVTQADGQALPSFMTYYPTSSSSNSEYSRTLFLSTYDTSLDNTNYDIKVKAWVIQDTNTITSSFTFNVKLTTEIADVMRTTLYFTTKVNVENYYPAFADTEYMTSQLILEDEGSDFITYNSEQGYLVVKPYDDQQIGEYNGKINYQMTTEDGRTYKIVQPFVLYVVDENGNYETDTSTSLNSTTTTDTTSSTSTEDDKNTIIISKTPDYQLKAIIKKITQNGLVTVEFNKEMYNNVHNYTLFNETILNIHIEQSLENSQQINFTWELVSFSNKQLQLQLYFSDPMQVSQYSVSLIQQHLFLGLGHFVYLIQEQLVFPYIIS